MNDESNKVKLYTKLIRRYLNISKPLGVSEIKFNLEPTGDKSEYYMDITYIVPEDSKFLHYKPKPNEEYFNHRYFWGHQIKKDIYNFFGLKVIINNSGIRSEKFNYD